MARTKGAKAKKTKQTRQMGPRAYLIRRGLRFIGNPTFTESFKYGTLLPNAGFLLTANIGNIPQLTQYSGLYQKYKILKAVFLLLPNWSGGESQTVAIYNTVSGNFPSIPGVSSAGSCRIVHVIDNSPDQSVPVSEDAVLQENGCKIGMATNMKRMSCRPVPDLKDANNVQLTLKNKFINFGTTAPNIAHYGIRGWITHPYSVGASAPTPGFAIADSLTFTVYCKLTFQVAEPR